MKIFDVSEAQYYCNNYSATTGKCQNSIRIYCHEELKGVHILKEGTAKFNEYRDCSLRNVERCLFLAASLYKSSHRLMSASSSSWTYVTLYYGAFYSASALLGMFGIWIDAPYIGVEVTRGNINSQELTIHRKKTLKTMTTYNGTHRMFWDLFYKAVRSLHAWVDPSLRFVIMPVSGSPSWQPDRRNEINYDSFRALTLDREFKLKFKFRQFPTSLPGILNTQFKITESLTLLAFKFAKDFGLNTDALDVLMPSGTRGDKIEKLIFNSRIRVAIEASKKAHIIS